MTDAMTAPFYAADGTRRGDHELPEALFAAATKGAVVHQALIGALANARLGTAATKNRARVAGGGAKPWRQKGTGRARQGSTRAPHWRHGGVVFGPNGRAYDQRIPKKMRRLAFAAALSAANTDGRIAVLEELRLDADLSPTKGARRLLESLGMAGEDAVLVGANADAALSRAFGNLPRVAVRTPRSLRLVDVLVADRLVFAKDALAGLAELRK